jgi:adenine-specific DNA-methyltransferase
MKEERLTGNIKAENKNLSILKKHFAHCFKKDGTLDFEKLKQELQEGEINFYQESYGLDWLGKSYARLLASDAATTLLKEEESFNQKEENKNSQNLLLKGDNLEVLKHLSHAYYEQVKMIYIDPPYNTGGDGFVYQDDRKFSVEELEELAGVSREKAQRILQFTQSKSNSHSAWLSFMYPRLYIAKQLLREDGVIFISIDDHEVAQLRLLMDEVFGEENFVVNICHKARASISNDKIISENHNHILFYTKNFEEVHAKRKNFGLEPILSGFNKEDENGKYKLVPVDGPGGSRKGNPYYEFQGINGYWRFSKERMQDMFERGLIVVTDDNLQQKYYLEKAKKNRKTDTSWWDEKLYTSNATRSLKDLMGGDYFTNPKPIPLITKMLELWGRTPNDLILDFFAGSGTTGDAVMQLNAEDGGNRRYILVQWPELIDPKKSKAAYQFVKEELGIATPTIFEITKERLIRAAKKIKTETILPKIEEKKAKILELQGKLDLNEKEEQIATLEAEIAALEEQDLGFRIFETMPIWEDYDFEAETFDPQAVLFDESQLTEADLKALLTTWKTYDGQVLTEELEEVDLGGYKSYYAQNGKLYLMDKGFTTDHLKTLLEKIDGEEEFAPASIIAFGYHFQSKSLRELSENLKAYANKKQIEIDFINRY